MSSTMQPGAGLEQPRIFWKKPQKDYKTAPESRGMNVRPIFFIVSVLLSLLWSELVSPGSIKKCFMLVLLPWTIWLRFLWGARYLLKTMSFSSWGRIDNSGFEWRCWFLVEQLVVLWPDFASSGHSMSSGHRGQIPLLCTLSGGLNN